MRNISSNDLLEILRIFRSYFRSDFKMDHDVAIKQIAMKDEARKNEK